jgi:D-xylose transport system ATP-binding protein
LDRRPGDLLAVHRVTKSFGHTRAVSDLSFELGRGEIVALLGENGAGKSTIIGVLAGLFGQDYDGELTIDGATYRPSDVADAERLGIVLIPQEINVVPDLSVAQTLFLNNEPTRFGFVDNLAMRRSARDVLDEFGVDVGAETRIGSLDLASQQLVIIARALHKEARILILDEPTAALTGDEADRLFDRLRTYRDHGTTCLFVSHRLAEVFAIADRILVMRDGTLAGDHRAEETSRVEIVDEMLGATSTPRAVRAAASGPQGRNLRVDRLTVASSRSSGRPLVDDVSFEVASGEIVGLFGLVGSGAGVVGKAIFGAWPGAVSGDVVIDGRHVSAASPQAAIADGIGYVAQDRRDALVGIHSVAENVVMADLAAFERGPFLDAAKVRTETRRRIDQLAIRTSGETAAVATLSGGNQQKVQVARWLVADTPILILDDPTRGVDVGARAEIHDILVGLAATGRALLMVSSDVGELLAICARVLVMRDGRLVHEVDASATTESALIAIAAGLDVEPGLAKQEGEPSR